MSFLDKKITPDFTIKTLLQSSVGGLLEFYDFFIFLILAKCIAANFFTGTGYVRILETYGVLASGYIARPIGGLILSHFGDKFGRKPIFLISVTVMAISTLIIALIPNRLSIGLWAPTILVTARIIQGFALGGEYPGSITFIFEHMPKGKMVFGICMLFIGFVLGAVIGSLVSYAVGIIFTEKEITDYAWRIPFFLGGIFGFVVYYMRRDMEETPIFKHIKSQNATFALPIAEIFKSYKLELLTSFLITLSFESILTFFTMIPVYMETILGYGYRVAFKISTINIVFGCLFLLILSLISLKIALNKRYMLFFSYPITAIVLIFYINILENKDLNMVYLAAILLFFMQLGVVAYNSIIPALFEARARFTGIATSVNVAVAIAGGFTPIIITLGSHNLGSFMGPEYFLTQVCQNRVIKNNSKNNFEANSEFL